MRSGSRILVAEREAAALLALREGILRVRPDARIESASTAEDALVRAWRARDKGEPYDVVVAALHLGLRTGLDLVDALAVDSPSTRAIIMSDAPAPPQPVLRAGRAIVFLHNPVAHEALRQAIEDAMGDVSKRRANRKSTP